MSPIPSFLSVVMVVRNQASHLDRILPELSALVTDLARDHEVIIVDNASQDDTIGVLKQLTGEDGLPNLQVFALTKEVDLDTAIWAGLENALGDFIVVADLLEDDLQILPKMLKAAAQGTDVVFAENENAPLPGVAYRTCLSLFNKLFLWANGMELASEAPRYRILSKRVVNFIQQHPLPALAYQHLPTTGGFSRKKLTYRSPPVMPRKKSLADSLDYGMRLLVSTTRAPLRLVTILCLFGALSNLIYSIYVIAVGIWKTDVQPGWVTLSLQQSGMFFLISLVLLVLGEYILHMESLTDTRPLYCVTQEFTSVVMTHRDKLNIEDGITVDSAGNVEPHGKDGPCMMPS